MNAMTYDNFPNKVISHNNSCPPDSFQFEDIGYSQRALQARTRLGHLASWQTSTFEYAVRIANAIEGVLGRLDITEIAFGWSVEASCFGTPGYITFFAENVKGKWEVCTPYLEAALSLWPYHYKECDRFKNKEQHMKYTDQSKSTKNQSPVQFARVLGPASDPWRRKLGWWIPKLAVFAYEDSASSNETVKLGFCHISTIKSLFKDQSIR